MLRSLSPRGMHTVDALHEEKGEQGEKQPGNLQPENAAGMGKRPQQGLAEGAGAPLRVGYLVDSVGVGPTLRPGLRWQ